MAVVSCPGSRHCGRAWKALLLLLVCNVSFISSLVMPKATSTCLVRPPTCLNVRKLAPSMKSARRNLKKITNHVVPPIPHQEEPLVEIQQQFRPRFVAREFALGVRTMWRIFPYLAIASFLTHAVRINVVNAVSVAGPVEGAVVSHHACASVLHFCENLIKFVTRKFLHIPRNSPVMRVFLGPVAEEVAYRGIGHGIGALASQIDLWWFVTCCRFVSPALVLGLHMFIALAWFLSVAFNMRNALAILDQMVSVVTVFVLYRPKLAIVSAFRSSGEVQGEESAENKTGIASGYEDDTATQVGPLNHTRFISRLVSSKNCTSSPELATVADLAVTRSARWYGASCFGMGHFSLLRMSGTNNGNTRELNMLNTMRFQKLVGTTMSSLLVESRLVIQRRTLWGAIGAHVTFNAMVAFLPFVLLLYPVLAILSHEKLRGPFMRLVQRIEERISREGSGV